MGEWNEDPEGQEPQGGNTAFPMSEWRPFPDLVPVIENRPELAPQVNMTSSAHVPVDRSKNMALFRVIATPE